MGGVTSKEAKARYREKHREELRQKGREYQARRRADPEYREQQRLRMQELRAADPERYKAEYRAWYDRRGVEWRREWRAKNIDKARAIASRARAKRALAPRIEPIDRAAVYQRDGGRCHICRRRVSSKRFELDHLVPLARGGEESMRNVAVAHPRCNRRRGAGWLPAQLRLVG